MAARRRLPAPPAVIPREPRDSLQWVLKRSPADELVGLIGAQRLKQLHTPPRHHQLVSMVLGLRYRSWMFALDMGWGKTKIALDLIRLRDLRHVLVVSPPSEAVMMHWAVQAGQHWPGVSVDLVMGSARSRRTTFLSSRARILVVSGAWLTRQFTAAGDDPVFARALSGRMRQFDGLIIDESHRFKSASSKGFRGLARYCIDIPHRYLLTGTPITGDTTGIWAQSYLIDRGASYGASYRQFLYQWYVPTRKKFGRKKFIEWKLRQRTRDEFYARFWRFALRYEESEGTDLPERVHTVLPVQLSARQLSAYRDALNSSLSGMALVSRLMEITSGIGFGSSPKFDALRSIVDEVVGEGGEQVIVWCWLRAEVRYLRRELVACGYSVVTYNGEHRDAQELERWRSGAVQILVANVESLCEGVELTNARYSIYWSNGRYLARAQSERRTRRPSQSSNRCYYYDLVCRGTVDDLALQRLQKRSDAFADFTRDREALMFLVKQL